MADGALNGYVSLREYLGDKFDALEAKLDSYVAENEKRLSDHEQRIRVVEKKSVWSNIADAGLAISTAILAFLGRVP